MRGEKGEIVPAANNRHTGGKPWAQMHSTRTSSKSPAASFIGVPWRGPASFLVLMILFLISQAGIPNTLSRGVRGTVTSLRSPSKVPMMPAWWGQDALPTPGGPARESNPGLHLGQAAAAERADGNIPGMGVPKVWASFAQAAAACWDCTCSE